jgi:hypothetical protein
LSQKIMSHWHHAQLPGLAITSGGWEQDYSEAKQVFKIRIKWGKTSLFKNETCKVLKGRLE